MIQSAYADAQTAAQGVFGSSFFMFLPIIFLFYFFIIRPQNKKTKEHNQLVNNLGKGDEVIISGGVLGKIVKLSDKFVFVNVADNVDLCVQKNAIANVLPKGTMKTV